MMSACSGQKADEVEGLQITNGDVFNPVVNKPSAEACGYELSEEEKKLNWVVEPCMQLDYVFHLGAHTSTKKTMSNSWRLFGAVKNKKLRILAYLSHFPKFLRVELTGIEPATS